MTDEASGASFKLRRSLTLLREAIAETTLRESVWLIAALAERVAKRFDRSDTDADSAERVLFSCVKLMASTADALRHGDKVPTIRIIDTDGTDITDAPMRHR